MRILHIIDTLNIGGAEKTCLNLISMLLDAGHQADCLVVSNKGPLFDFIDKRSKALFLDRKNKYNIRKIKKCAHIASEYDIVHAHMRHTWVYVKLSFLLFGCTSKLIVHDHFGDFAIDTNPTFRLKGPFKPRYYIGVNRSLTDWAERDLKISKDSIFLLENTIIPQHNNSNKYQGDWIMISNIRQTKNLLFSISLAEKMKRKLVIFGNHDGSSYADEVLKYASDSEFVTIVQGETDIQKYLNNFQLGIHASISETGPLVLLEYLAHGLPFISFDTGEVVNQIKHILPDFVASTFNYEEWITKINSIEQELNLNKEDLHTRLRNIFNEKFSTEAYLRKCLQIYQSVLSS